MGLVLIWDMINSGLRDWDADGVYQGDGVRSDERTHTATDVTRPRYHGGRTAFTARVDKTI